MKNGTCPRCGSGNVYMKKEGLGTDVNGVYVYTSMITSISRTDDYVCTDCGYFERYIDDIDKMADVARKWDRVG